MRAMAFVVAALLVCVPVEGKKKAAKKKAAVDKSGFINGESDEEFRTRLLGSNAPQAQRIVTGSDPRLSDEAEEGSSTYGKRLDKIADDELSEEDREAKRSTEIWKLGNAAKEFAYKWKVRGLERVLMIMSVAV